MGESDEYRITSPQNERIKAVVRLAKKSGRDETGLIAIEGVREIARALRARVTMRAVYYCREIIATEEERALLEMLKERNVPLVSVAAPAFRKIAYREDSGGFVAVAEKPHQGLDDLRTGPDALYLAVDAVEKPGNLGALFRSADAAGASGVIISAPKTDLHNPNVIRASLGTVFSVPVAVTRAQHAIGWLKSNGIAVITTSPEADVLYTETDMVSPCVIVVGSEDAGLGREWFEASDRIVRIPMRGSADSLNVSVAATILLYEALRQRGAVHG
jgi:TrmH family RNA methyltransferase